MTRATALSVSGIDAEAHDDSLLLPCSARDVRAKRPPPPLQPVPGLAPAAEDDALLLGSQSTEVDAALRRIVNRESSERMALGRLAEVFSVRHAHHDLGFACIGDYTRERLGISRSEFYDLAQVATSLAALPSIEGALARGGISWTKARELVSVAAPDTQERWLAVAAQCTADQLHALIASVRAKIAAASSESPGPKREDSALWGEGSLDDEEIDGELAVNVVIRSPRSVRLLWWEVLRLSCRVAGCELAPWQSAEFIAAEGLSESGWPREPFDFSRSGRRFQSAARDGAGELAGISLPALCDDRARAERDHLSRMAARYSGAVTAEQLDGSMRAAITRMQRIDADLGLLLCRMADGRLHRRLGYTAFGDYCRNALGISTRKARALVAIQRMRRRTGSRLSSAYGAGVLSWHRCLVLLPVLTERTADAWIERAQLVTARRLGDEVLWARMACDAGLQPEAMPPQLGARLETDLRHFVQIRGRSRVSDAAETTFGTVLLDAEIRFRAPISVADMFRSAIFARHTPGEPVWMGLLRLLEHARAFWLTAPKHRDPIFERDGWRCSVPACSSRRNLHDHHVVFKSQGGDNDRDNRVAVCASHHQHGIHRGVVRATGKAGVGLDWELGRRHANGALLRVSGRGEVYLPAAAATTPFDWVGFVPVQKVAHGTPDL